MKVLGIGGSPRNGGNTDIILEEILRGVRDSGGKTEAVFLRNYDINQCTGCERCRNDLTCTRFSDGMISIYPKIEDADVLVLGSPVYNYNITGLMKLFIDRLYPYYIFSEDRPRRYGSRLAGKNKISVVFSVCEQTAAGETGFAIEAMSRPLEALGYTTRQSFQICGFFDKGAVSYDADVMKEAYSTGVKLAGSAGE